MRKENSFSTSELSLAQKLKKKRRQNRFQTVLATALLVLILAVAYTASIWAILEVLPYIIK